MKKLFIIPLIVLMVSALIFGGCAAPAPAPVPAPAPAPPPTPEVFKWRIQHMMGPAMLMYSKGFMTLIEMIEENTDGRVIIEPYTAGSLVEVKEMFTAASQGIIDGYLAVGGYWVGIDPVFGVEDTMPFALQTYKQMEEFMWGDARWDTPYEPFIREQYAKHGLYYLTGEASDTMWILTKKPIKDIEDIKGYKIRSWGIYAKTLECLGASVVMTALGETYTGLATGVFDGVNTGTGGYIGFKLYEHAKYMMVPPIGATIHHISINKKAWDKLPPDLQMIVDLTAHNHATWATRNVRPDTDIPYAQELLKEKGVQYTQVETGLDKLRACADKIWDDTAAGSPAAAEGIRLLREFCKLKGIIK